MDDSEPIIAAEALQLWSEALSGRDRSARREAAHAFALAAVAVPDKVLPYVPVLIQAVSRPEAQTRWDALSALAALAPLDVDEVALAFEGAEAALFDEDSELLRVNAFQYFCALGACDPLQSLKAWSLIDEALQCYHGDPEYEDLLYALKIFVRGSIDSSVRQALIDRLAFDAQNFQGSVGVLVRKIIEMAQ